MATIKKLAQGKARSIANDAAVAAGVRHDDFASARMHIIAVSDRLSEMIAMLEEGGDTGEMMPHVAETLLTVWRARWELGLHPKDVVWGLAPSEERGVQP